MRFGCVILAAGGSVRLGAPKQLLCVDGETLLRRVVRIAREANSAAIVVVLGANAERMTDELSAESVVTVRNPDWETGMASSLRAGVGALLALADPPDAVVVLLCDQPALTPETIVELVQTATASGASAGLCRYDDGIDGPPCYFAARVAPRLLALEGQLGARAFIARLPAADVVRVPFARGNRDIDTPDDWARFCAQRATESHAG